jgi:hypothetical protein
MAAPPDPAVVGDRWKEMWRTRIENADFLFKQWATHQARDDYWSATAVRDHYADVGVPVFIMSGWQDGYKNPVEHVISGHRLGEQPASATYTSNAKPVLDTEMLETSSWGECGNDDLPGNQAPFDRESLTFDSDPLPKDLDSFGYPEVTLNLTSDRRIAALAIRLNEVSPAGESHLVTYRFYNLADRGGDMAKPQRIEPGVPFTLRVPLNIMGHIFKKGWRIRLALSPSFYPTLWESPEPVTITLKAGEADGLPPSALSLPGREAREEDKRAQELLPTKSAGVYVNPDDYLPTLVEARATETTRAAKPVTINGKPGILTRKVFDSGRYQYGGPLQSLWVDQIAEENFEMVIGDPLSLTGYTKSTTILERPDQGWRTRAETTTNVWSEADGSGGYVFRYLATVKAFIGGQAGSEDQPFQTKTVEGAIARSWI